MFDESDLEKTRARWQSQEAHVRRLSTATLRTRAMKLDRLMGRAKFAVGFGGTVALPACGWLVYTFPTALQRLGGMILLVAVALQIHRVWELVVRTRAHADTRNTMPSVAAYRTMLDRQRRFHGGAEAGARQMAFAAGFLLFLTGSAQVDGWDGDLILFAGLCVALPLGVFFNGRAQAKRYQREVEEIDQFQLEGR